MKTQPNITRNNSDICGQPKFPAIAQMHSRVLAWYALHQRKLPWRTSANMPAIDTRPNPYHVWLSEIMLQQTAVATVTPYFHRFIERFPDLGALADAELDEVLTLWQGLGYYARARNLHRCARHLREHFPRCAAGLSKLPGIGNYTAAAIASIAFDESVIAFDTNNIRVMARVFGLTRTACQLRPEFDRQAQVWAPLQHAGSFNQGLMDIGSSICRARSPDCTICPLQDICIAYAKGIQDTCPAPKTKVQKPVRHGKTYVINAGGHILLTRRAPKGLLGGLYSPLLSGFDKIPGHDTQAMLESWSETETIRWHAHASAVRHVFSHFIFEGIVMSAQVSEDLIDTLPVPDDYCWVPVEKLEGVALSALARQILKTALEGE